jgi:predicted Ser/Thr protein kinase
MSLAHDSPTSLGRYQLVRVLGEGAMGVVYEATDPRLGRTVAIKTVQRSLVADPTTAGAYAKRFEREAMAAGRLSHPNIVTVFDFGEQGDFSYIVMEFVRGRELLQAFDSGHTFTLSDACRIMGELLDALAFAHEHGVVHRDVKPANVMLDAAGRVKLTDFGVARMESTPHARTVPGTLLGTPSYMSPEQVLGNPVGPRADLFAAGVILYQFLTGQRPFTGGAAAVQHKIVHSPVTPPSTLNPALPGAFDRIIAKALAKEPEDRYDSAVAFAADLRRAMGLEPVLAMDLELPVDDHPAGGHLRLPPQAPPPAKPPPRSEADRQMPVVGKAAQKGPAPAAAPRPAAPSARSAPPAPAAPAPAAVRPAAATPPASGRSAAPSPALPAAAPGPVPMPASAPSAAARRPPAVALRPEAPAAPGAARRPGFVPSRMPEMPAEWAPRAQPRPAAGRRGWWLALLVAAVVAAGAWWAAR